MIQETRFKISYKGNGQISSYDYPYPYRLKEDIKALIIDINGNLLAANGSFDEETKKYTLSKPLENGFELLLYRETPIEQLVDLPKKYPYDLMEGNEDRLTMISQEFADRLNRSAKVPITSNIKDLELPDYNGGSFLQWDPHNVRLKNTQALDLDGIKNYLDGLEAKATDIINQANTDAASIQGQLKAIEDNTLFAKKTEVENTFSQLNQTVASSVSNLTESVNSAIQSIKDNVSQSISTMNQSFEDYKALPVNADTLDGAHYNDVISNLTGTNAPVITPLIDWDKMASENSNTDVRTMSAYDKAKAWSINTNKKVWLKDRIKNYDYLLTRAYQGQNWIYSAFSIIPVWYFEFAMSNFAKCVDLMTNYQYLLARPYDNGIAPTWETFRSTPEYLTFFTSSVALAEIYGITIERK